jgi:hypothetical protein
MMPLQRHGRKFADSGVFDFKKLFRTLPGGILTTMKQNSLRGY